MFPKHTRQQYFLYIFLAFISTQNFLFTFDFTYIDRICVSAIVQVRFFVLRSGYPHCRSPPSDAVTRYRMEKEAILSSMPVKRQEYTAVGGADSGGKERNFGKPVSFCYGKTVRRGGQHNV